MDENRDRDAPNGNTVGDNLVDWSRFGLNKNEENRTNSQRDSSTYDGFSPDIYHPTGVNELFAQEYVCSLLTIL